MLMLAGPQVFMVRSPPKPAVVKNRESSTELVGPCRERHGAAPLFPGAGPRPSPVLRSHPSSDDEVILARQVSSPQQMGLTMHYLANPSAIRPMRGEFDPHFDE